MGTNIDAMPFLGGLGAPRRQVGQVKEIPLTAAWSQPPDQPSAIADRCRAAMFGVYLRYKNIPEETARHIFQEHKGGCAGAWLRVDAHERRMSEPAKLARPGLRDRCLAAMFGLYLRCKGITEDTAREIFKGHVGNRRACVLAWFKVHGQLSDAELAFDRLVPALWKQAEKWVAPYEWARHLRSAAIQKAMDSAFRRVVGASDQTRRDAGGLERFAAQALKEALREELTPHWRDRISRGPDDAACAAARDVAGPQATLSQAAETSQELAHASCVEELATQPPKDGLHEKAVAQWRERFAQACAGAAWDDGEVRALMGLLSAGELSELREKITASAQKAGPRAGALLATDPERLAVQIIAGEVGIHRAFRTIPAESNLADWGRANAPIKVSRGGASGLAALGGMEASPWPQRQSDAVRFGRGQEPEEVSASNGPDRLRTEAAAESLDRSWRRLNQGLDPLWPERK